MGESLVSLMTTKNNTDMPLDEPMGQPTVRPINFIFTKDAPVGLIDHHFREGSDASVAIDTQCVTTQCGFERQPGIQKLEEP